MSTQIRRFRRDDRDQLTALVNAHVQAVVPGIVLSTNRVLSQLEREPGEFVVDAWVAERLTLVADQRGRVSAAAHLLRYRDEPDVGDRYRGVGEIRWLLCWPDAPFWPDGEEAGAALLVAALEILRSWSVARILSDPSLPAPGVYGIPAQWPHVERLMAAAGFAPGAQAEVVLVAHVAQLAPTMAPPGVTLRRRVGVSGTRLTALDDEDEIGYVEVEIAGGEANQLAAISRWADIGNLWVDPGRRRRGVGRWLVGQAASWLALGHVGRLLAYVDGAEEGELAFHTALGFTELTRTRRGWRLPGHRS